MTETIIIDRVLPRIGRLKKATGTTNKTVANKINRMVTALLEDGRDDLLRAIISNKLSLLQVYGSYQRRELDKLPTAGTALPLTAAWLQWIKEKECVPAHKRSLAQSLRHLHAPANATIADLPALLEAARIGLKGKPQSFRLLRSGAQAFVKAQLKRNHALYGEVTAVEPMKASPKRVKHPATVAEVRGIMAKMEWGHAQMVWTLACTGMRPNEMWGKWYLTISNGGPLHVVIQGTKTRGAKRIVPDAGASVGALCSYAAFLRALRVASDGQMTPYDLRRTYATWLEQAGIPRTRRRLYMGHGNSDMTDLYETIEVKQFLAEDAAKLRAFVGEGNQGLRIAK